MFVDDSRPPASFSLRTWFWRSYVGAAMVPLLLIELTFLGIYWGTGEFVFDRGAEAVTTISKSALSDATMREAETISAKLQTVAAMTQLYAGETGRALNSTAAVSAEEKARHAYSPDGVFYSAEDNGGSAVFYSGVMPIGPEEQEKVWRTVSLDPLMKEIVGSDPLITQVYLNTWDSLNRIYPYFDVLEIYAPKMDIPSYNFYYEADADHNPSGKVVWTDAYIDPAGSGWMVSAIAPVMGAERLEAVVGIDVTVRSIVEQVLDFDFGPDGYAMLVGRDGTLLALPPAGEVDLNVSELLEHDYSEAILADTFKPSEFNVFRRKDLGPLALAMQGADDGSIELNLGRPVIASWSTVVGTDWKLIGVAGVDSLLANTVDLRSTLGTITQVMTVVLIAFYGVYFLILWMRSEKMSALVGKPLSDLEAEMERTVKGEDPVRAVASPVLEIERARKHLIGMAEKLASVSRSKSAFISAMSHELRTPLTSIFGHTELLQLSEGKTLDHERMGHVNGIARAGNDLLTLIDSVLELSLADQAQIEARTKVVSIRSVGKEVIAAARPEAERLGLVLTEENGPALPNVVTDPKLVRRIMEQLVSNALKYNRPGGTVKVRYLQNRPAFVTVEIEDTGKGISEDLRDRVFEAFDRLGHENSTTLGAGIGLTVARRLAALIGCELDFVSTPGEGTTFRLQIPVAA